MSQTSFVPIVRVAVISQNRMLDLSLPTNIPIREVILSIEPLLTVGLENEKFTTAQLTLGKLGQSPFSLDTTLDAVEVVDGDLLIFQSKIDPEDNSPSVVEDIAQISTLLASPSPRQFRYHFYRAVSLQFLGTLSALIIILYLVRTMSEPHQLRSIITCVSGIIMSFGLMFAAFQLNTRPRNAKIASLYAMSALGGIFISLLWLQDGIPTKESLFCSFAITHVLIWIGIFKFTHYRALWTAVLATTGVSTIISGAYCIWFIPQSVIGCFLYLAAMAYQLYASTIAMFFARLPLPHVPGVGEKSIEILSKHALQRMRAKVRQSRQYQNGIIASSVLLQAISAMYLITDGWVCWVMISVGILATMLRSRIWVDQLDKTWLISSLLIVPLAVILQGIFTKNFTQVLIVSIVVGVIALIYIAVCANFVLTFVDTYPLPLRHAIALISYALDVFLIVGMVYLTGLFAQVLHR